MPRPRSDKPYICGPYAHRNKFRIFVYTPRGDGGRDRLVQSFDTRTAAETRIKSYERVSAASGRTIADAVVEYLAYLERKGNKTGSITTARYRLDAILDGTRALIDMTPRRAQEWYDELVDEGGATDTQKGCLVQAKAFGKFCVKRTWLAKNPFEPIESVGRKSKGKAQLGIDDARVYREYCLDAWAASADRSAIAALIPMAMGLRTNEVAQLLASDVDDRGRLLRVGEHEAKTEAGRRLMAVSTYLVEPLRALAAAPAVSDGHLFALRRGVPADRHWVLRTVRRHMKAAGVKVVSAHGLRGTFATMADISGSDRRATAKAMGHTTPSMTEAHYIDARAASDAAIVRASDVLGDVERVSVRDRNVTHSHDHRTDEE